MDLDKVETILEDKGARPFDVMEALQDIQEEFRYLPEEAMCRTAEAFDVPPLIGCYTVHGHKLRFRLLCQ